MPIPVAVRSNVYIWSHLIAGIECSNPAEGMGFVPYICFLCRGLCDELFTQSEKPYRVCVCVCVCVCMCVT
jgi:hypothetical protein